jgi:hypothetical protein
VKNFFSFVSMAVGDGGTNLYIGGYLNLPGVADAGLARISAVIVVTDPLYARDTRFTLALLPTERGLYVGGFGNPYYFDANSSRYSLTFLPVADAPQLIQDSFNEFIHLRNTADRFGGHSLPNQRHQWRNVASLGWVRCLNTGDFITVADGDAGLRIVSGGTVTVVSALNNTPAGIGTANSTLTMVTNPAPVFKFSVATYSVREGQGSIVVTVRKYGSGPATVSYTTSDLAATSGLDYQPRSGSLSFLATDRFKNIIVAIADDFQIEGDEQFAITLHERESGSVDRWSCHYHGEPSRTMTSSASLAP